MAPRCTIPISISALAGAPRPFCRDMALALGGLATIKCGASRKCNPREIDHAGLRQEGGHGSAPTGRRRPRSAGLGRSADRFDGERSFPCARLAPSNSSITREASASSRRMTAARTCSCTSRPYSARVFPPWTKVSVSPSKPNPIAAARVLKPSTCNSANRSPLIKAPAPTSFSRIGGVSGRFVLIALLFCAALGRAAALEQEEAGHFDYYVLV